MVSLLSQSDSGKAWEYGLALAVADVFNAAFSPSNYQNIARIAYERLGGQERGRIDNAAREAVLFLRTHDKHLDKVKAVSMQPDNRGRGGDVRDLLIYTESAEIGISAKHRHKAVKHSRLSPSIDFGQQWYGRPCSATYWQAVKPVFDRLESAKRAGQYWRDLPAKAETIYAPIVRAFIDEIRNAPAEPLLRYMLGVYDYYKVVKDNGDVLLQSFNIAGGLGWGRRIAFPTRIIDVEHSRNSTATVTFDRGWALSFRLHNAESRAVPMVKFDVNLIGTPTQASHTIRYGDG